VLISTNRGLCGSLNSNLFRMLLGWLEERKEKKIDFITLGEKGQHLILKTGYELIADFSELSDFTEAVGPLSQIVTAGFLSGEYQQIWLVYSDFVSALKQVPTVKRLLPIATKLSLEEKKGGWFEYVFEPSEEEILDWLLPYYLETLVREAILEAVASEHSARMVAMKNATNNALSLIEGLTLEYNKERQKTITAEIADITTAKISITEGER